jgi:lambda family phage holin
VNYCQIVHENILLTKHLAWGGGNKRESYIGGEVNIFSLQLIEESLKWMVVYLPAFYAAIASFSISVLMGIYDGKAFLKTLTGSLACGIFTLAISGCLGFFGLPDNAVTFVGAAIGLAGVEKMRNRLFAFFDSKTGGTKNENE